MKSGEIRTGLFSAQTIDIGGEQRVILVITDITEQVKAKEALRKSEEKFSKAFRASPGVNRYHQALRRHLPGSQ